MDNNRLRLLAGLPLLESKISPLPGIFAVSTVDNGHKKISRLMAFKTVNDMKAFIASMEGKTKFKLTPLKKQVNTLGESTVPVLLISKDTINQEDIFVIAFAASKTGAVKVMDSVHDYSMDKEMQKTTTFIPASTQL